MAEKRRNLLGSGGFVPGVRKKGQRISEERYNSRGRKLERYMKDGLSTWSQSMATGKDAGVKEGLKGNVEL